LKGGPLGGRFSGTTAKSAPAFVEQAQERSDMHHDDKAWKEVMDLATKHALIVQAYGGVAVLFHPEEQRKQGIRARTLWAARGGKLAEAERIAAEEEALIARNRKRAGTLPRKRGER
jgi:hypothetical protein